jgi:beta-lactamase class A
MLDRRTLITALAAAPALMPAAARAIAPVTNLNSSINAIEQRSGGRLGVAALDLQTGQRFAWRGDQRFRMCSTFKMPLSAAILRRVDQGRERLDRVIPYGPEVLMGNSNATKQNLGKGMTVGALCEATIIWSDNAAANLLLDALEPKKGPEAMTRFLRAIGDQTTRVDRYEPEINTGPESDLRDTTTPTAILATWKALLVDDALSPASRQQLTAWVVANRTGDKRIRAGLPRGWKVGDKTGNNGESITNDIAIAWPPGRKPALIAAFHDRGSSDDDKRSAVLAEVTRAIVAAGFGQPPKMKSAL